jgi:serine/threonine protein kinase
MASDPRRLQELFGAALVQHDPAARKAFLDCECGGGTLLREQVEVPLTAQDDPHATLHQALAPGAININVEIDATRDLGPTEQIGAIIAGKYKLLQEIGEGGLGSVFMADQMHPLKRRVAVKVIKAGMDTARVLARFEAERQALALMDHPNIAKVLDAGTTENEPECTNAGRPFFVMELVKGVPISQFCDDHKLPVPERLNVFMQVCSAVQHAHHKGIIHRDLKPSNILVESHDGKPMPKVIDFGLAKATSGMQLTEQTLFTAFGEVAGTPLYMSPEQAAFNALDVDTRADIYALGVILYELLTGTTPIERHTLKKGAFDEVLRVIREQEPPTPSSRLSSLESKTSVAAARQMEPAKLGRFVRGDLDWIVMKALAKERERRYESATALARDLERFLTNEPVQAGPPSAGYKLRKFVRRHRGPVVAATAVLLSILTGAGIAIWQAVRAEQARHREAQRAEGETQAKVVAEQRLNQIEKANVILGSIFKDLNPRTAEKDGKPISALLGERLDQATEQIEGDAIGDTLAVARMQLILGESQLGLGYSEKAIGLFTKARATFIALLGPDHPQTFTSMGHLAEGYRAAGKLDLALPLFEETLKLRKTKLGPDHLHTISSVGNLAAGYRAAGKFDLALPLYEEAFKQRKAKLGADHPHTLASMGNLATGYQDVGKLDLALPLYEETNKLMKAKLGADHHDTLASMGNLAIAYQTAGKFDLALPLYEETIKLMKAKLGPDHPHTVTTLGNLAAGYRSAGKLDLALPLYEETFKQRKAKLGPDHPHTLASMGNLAAGYQDIGKLDLALPLHEETVKLKKAKLGADHPNTLISMHNLAMCYQEAGKIDLALPLFQETLKLQKAKLGTDHPNTLATMNNIASAYLVAGRSDDALPFFDQFLTGQRRQEGANSARFAAILAQVSTELLKAKQFAAAETYIRECLGICEKEVPNAWTTFNTKSLLGGSLLGQQHYADAEPLLLAGYEGMKQRATTIPKESQVRLADAAQRLVQLYETWDKPIESAKWKKELDEISRAGASAKPSEPPKP